jgi:hypothetical protein
MKSLTDAKVAILQTENTFLNIRWVDGCAVSELDSIFLPHEFVSKEADSIILNIRQLIFDSIAAFM